MRNMKMKLSVAITLMLLAMVALCVYGRDSAKRALAECLRPTTVIMLPLPEGCVHTNESPPASAMRIIEDQRNSYHLSLQEVVVFRIPNGGSPLDSDFTKWNIDEESRKRWLPLYVGCCTYQFRRHVAVIVPAVGEHGSLVVTAALVQSRWDYLRLNWDTNRNYWN